ncbi:MAG: adventurous gliding motility lipoprotein CglB [Myxococcales bacterium]|nr:adventurous gliding motility lipoprotein CglB [Myxococcales bacterium]
MNLRTMAGAVAVAALGCQVSDFEPVEPLAIARTHVVAVRYGRESKPNLMLLVDKSGSMDAPVDPALPSCQTPSGPCGGSKASLCDTSVCPTRWSELQGAMAAFLASSGTVGRFGLTTFPADAQCGPPDQVRVELAGSDEEASLQARADEIRSELLRIQSAGTAGSPYATGGGTPTGAALAMLGAYSPLRDPGRGEYVLLLTDGLPNCNPQNPNDYLADKAACRCTLQGSQCPSPYNRLGCLDAAGAEQAVRSLRADGIQTVVVGFGAEVQGSDARQVLTRLAVEGGFRASCEKDADCGGAVCDLAARVCPSRYFAAGNRAELSAALAAIAGSLPGACVVDIEPDPAGEHLISVLVDRKAVPRGPDAWEYVAGRVELLGELCQRVKASTAERSVRIEVTVVEPL